MNRIDDCLLHRAPAYVRLVGGNNERKSSSFQLAARIRNPRQDFELAQRTRRIGFAVALQRAVDHAVAIEEHRGPAAMNPLLIVAHAICRRGAFIECFPIWSFRPSDSDATQ